MTDYREIASGYADVLRRHGDLSDPERAKFSADAAVVHALLAIADRLPLSDTQTAAGLRAEMEDRFAQMQSDMDLRFAKMAHPSWYVPLTEDEEGGDAAGSGPVRPCDAPSPSAGTCAAPDLQGRENGAEQSERDKRRAALDELRKDINEDIPPDRLVRCETHGRAIPCRHGSDESPCAYPGEPLTEEPPVGTQVVDQGGNLWSRAEAGWRLWAEELSGWTVQVGWETVLSNWGPLRLATDADYERVGLPRDQWPSKPETGCGCWWEYDPKCPKHGEKPRILGPDEIAVKVPEHVGLTRLELAQRLQEICCKWPPEWRVFADIVKNFADALEAREGR